jgi:hypothetical protein
MTRTTRFVLALLIAATLLGGYVIVAKEGPAAKDSSGDSSSVFLH